MSLPCGMRGGTLRDESRATDGAIVAKYAALIGTPLLPWQRYVADVAGELDSDGTYHYDTVVLSTPRQCGKSTLVDAIDTRNAMWGADRRIYYLAQTGKDASEHFKGLLRKLGDSPLSGLCGRAYLGAGDLRQSFINGSIIRPMSVTKVAGHGVQGDKITLDEAFSLSAENGQAILDGFLPTMATRLKKTGVRPQLWITSTEGTAESVFFNSWLDSCRAGQQSSRTAWFDWGIPADSDPMDLTNIMAHHPAAGLLWDKKQLRDFKQQYEHNPRGFARAFGNRRDVGVGERAIDPDMWAHTSIPPTRPAELIGNDTLCFGVAVDIDGLHTAIVAAYGSGDDVHVQMVELLDGTGSAPDEIMRLASKYGAPIAIDSKGYAADLAARLDALSEAADTDILHIPTADFMRLAPTFTTMLSRGGIRHAENSVLDASVAGAAKRWAGDTWRVSRRQSTDTTAPLDASMLAVWGVQNHETTELQIF